MDTHTDEQETLSPGAWCMHAALLAHASHEGRLTGSLRVAFPKFTTVLARELARAGLATWEDEDEHITVTLTDPMTGGNKGIGIGEPRTIWADGSNLPAWWTPPRIDNLLPHDMCSGGVIPYPTPWQPPLADEELGHS